jgi:hypothetical protein
MAPRQPGVRALPRSHARSMVREHARASLDGPIVPGILRAGAARVVPGLPRPAQRSGVGGRGPGNGVSCAACHVRAGKIVGARALPASTSSHAVQAVAGFDGSQLCGGCHQFMFPRAALTPFLQFKLRSYIDPVSIT